MPDLGYGNGWDDDDEREGTPDPDELDYAAGHGEPVRLTGDGRVP